MKVLDYVYLGLYRLLLKTNEKDIVEFSAVIFLTIGLSFYLILLLGFLNFDASKYFPIRSFGFVIGGIIGVGNYFRYIRSGRHEILFKKYINSPPHVQKLNMVLSVTFVVASLASLIIHKIVTT